MPGFSRAAYGVRPGTCVGVVGNGEGQLCDPEPRTGSMFCFQYAKGLCYKASHRQIASLCVCVRTKQEILCGTDGETYENICQLRAVQCRLAEQKKVMVANHGPCRASECISFISFRPKVRVYCQFKYNVGHYIGTLTLLLLVLF